MLERVVTGGQSGSDRPGSRAAYQRARTATADGADGLDDPDWAADRE
jgi:hypothetical protein